MARFTVHFGEPMIEAEIFVPDFFFDHMRVNITREKFYASRNKLQVLWLLHGAAGNSADWTRYTALEQYLNTLPLVVVCPSAHNSFYTSWVDGTDWMKLITEDLWNWVNANLPVSSAPQDNFIAGASMGGYGAVLYALSKCGKYSIAGSFSGALEAPQEYARGESLDLLSYGTYGDPDKTLGGQFDLFSLAEKTPCEKRPVLYLSCGKKDAHMYGPFKRFTQHVIEMGYHTIVDDNDSGHDWESWDKDLLRFISNLPLRPFGD